MKKKISIRLILIGVTAIVLTAIIALICFYNILKNTTKQELKTYVNMLMLNDNFVDNNTLKHTNNIDDVRITLINEGGTVLYDSKSSEQHIDSHSDRVEVIDTLEEGESVTIRYSDTFGKRTMYYAKLLENGKVLRVSAEVENFMKLLIQIVPYLLVFVVVLIILCIISAYYFTIQIVKPIETISENLEHVEEVAIYEELRPFVKKILSQNSVRREFTANVSHELKTPLTSISGYAQLIEMGIAKEDNIQNFAQKIDKESNRLLGLINDIMNLTMIEENINGLEKVRINLLEVAEECKQNLDFKAEKNNIAFSIVGDEVYINGYLTMIMELIYNLCDNAIQYNKEGGFVVVSIYSLQENAILSIKDNGIGISKKHQDHIFERFYRVDKSHSKATGGTGLGLSIVKHVVKNHNATIELISEEGEGTEIKVLFPIN